MNKDLFFIWTGGFIFSLYFTIYDSLAFLTFFFFIFQEWHGGRGARIPFYCWMLNEMHIHWLENNCLLLYFSSLFIYFFSVSMHPSNLDHKDMQRRGVQTFQARGGVRCMWVCVCRRGWVGDRKIIFFKKKRLAGTCLVPYQLCERIGEVKRVSHLN